MKRLLALAFGTVTYGIFFATFLYLVGFLSGLVVPKTIDSGAAGSLGWALVVDVALIALFGVQHSVMARPGFKAWWTRFVPAPIERSVYVLASSAVLIALLAWWRPIPATVWSATGALGTALTALLLGGVGLVLYATFLIDHFDLFGLRQVMLYFRRRSYSERHFAMPALYRFLRHPLYLGWFVTFWATPTMTVGHLLFAMGMSAYILLAIPLEERDLQSLHGESYRRWRESTPAFVPRVRSKQSTAPARRMPA